MLLPQNARFFSNLLDYRPLFRVSHTSKYARSFTHVRTLLWCENGGQCLMAEIARMRNYLVSSWHQHKLERSRTVAPSTGFVIRTLQCIATQRKDFFFFFKPFPLGCGVPAADTILLQPVLSWTSYFVVLIALMFRLTQSIHLCFGLPRFLLPGGTISRVCLPT